MEIVQVNQMARGHFWAGQSLLGLEVQKGPWQP